MSLKIFSQYKQKINWPMLKKKKEKVFFLDLIWREAFKQKKVKLRLSNKKEKKLLENEKRG